MKDRISAQDSARGRAESSDEGCLQPESSDESIDTEMDALLREGIALGRRPNLDEAEIERWEARLQAASDKREKALAERLAALKTSHPEPPPRYVLPKAYRAPFVAAILLVVLGALFEISIGSAYIFAGTNEYRAAMPWIWGVLLPLFAVSLYRMEQATQGMRRRYPTWAVRWLVMYPLTVILCIGLVVVAPLGWMAVLGWIVGVPSDQLVAQVVSIDAESSNSKTCRRYAELMTQEVSAKICVARLLSGPVPKPGDQVTVVGRVSRLGVYIEEVRLR